MYNKKKSTKMKKNKIIFLMIMLVIFIFITTVFGRYITSSIHDFFLRSKEFYFYKVYANIIYDNSIYMFSGSVNFNNTEYNKSI